MARKQGQPSTVSPQNVAKAIVIKDDDVFVVSEHTGEIPTDNHEGFGLYFNDCRFLNGYESRLAGKHLNALLFTSNRGAMADFEMSNRQMRCPGRTSIPQQSFGITLQRVVEGGKRKVHDLYTITNYDAQEHECPLSFHFESAFEDIFEIRGLHPHRSGRMKRPSWKNGALVFSYAGADGVHRSLRIHHRPKPHATVGSGSRFRFKLAAGMSQQIRLCFEVSEAKEGRAPAEAPHADSAALVSAIERRQKQWLETYAHVESDHRLLNRVLKRSLLDLSVLKSSIDNYSFFSGGLPWYGALFGRDSILTALETLAYETGIAEQTLRLLANLQGARTNHWRDEEPGKILHELRRGELANLNEVPQNPYYGSVDSTPLFLMLLGEQANWTGDLRLFLELREVIERALRWMDDCGTRYRGRYLWYETQSRRGLRNQGWKDSEDGIVNQDGSLAAPPIAPIEAQAYAYRAKLLMAGLYERSGDKPTASRLRAEAARLREDFNRDFWLDRKQFYALALQKGGRPAAVVSSNPGHALWAGIVDPEKAAAVAGWLMGEEMFTGWGIRTLSRRERRYNPIGYHLGTVWPHDNALIAAGLRRYAFDRQACLVLEAMLNAAWHFEHQRLPEVFCGFSDSELPAPVHYPVACHPQAVAAGAVPLMLTSILGLEANAFNRRLLVRRPVLLDGVRDLAFRRIRLGDATIDLYFRKSARGQLQVEHEQQGKAVVVVEQATEAIAA